MKQHRSAQGKMIDMAALAARNEKVRAVGNMKVNARGDTIDATGKVVVPVTQKVGAQYQKTVGNKSANAKKVQEVKAVPPAKVKEQLTEEEMDLEASFNDDLEVEEIKAKEKK